MQLCFKKVMGDVSNSFYKHFEIVSTEQGCFLLHQIWASEQMVYGVYGRLFDGRGSWLMTLSHKKKKEKKSVIKMCSLWYLH